MKCWNGCLRSKKSNVRSCMHPAHPLSKITVVYLKNDHITLSVLSIKVWEPKNERISHPLQQLNVSLNPLNWNNMVTKTTRTLLHIKFFCITTRLQKKSIKELLALPFNSKRLVLKKANLLWRLATTQFASTFENIYTWISCCSEKKLWLPKCERKVDWDMLYSYPFCFPTLQFSSQNTMS